MAPRYVKKILEFSKREKSAEKFFVKSTITITAALRRWVPKVSKLGTYR
jgi:hypothetical protein